MEAVGRAVSPCLSGGEVQTLPLPDEYLARVAVAFRFNRLRIPCILCVTKNKFLVEFLLVADDYEVSRAAKLPDKDVTQVFKFVSSADRWYSVLRSGSSCDVYVDTPTGFQQTKSMENVASVSLVDNDTDGSQRVRVTFVGDSEPLITDFEHAACVKPITVKPKEPITKALSAQVVKFTALLGDSEREKRSTEEVILSKLTALSWPYSSVVNEKQLVKQVGLLGQKLNSDDPHTSSKLQVCQARRFIKNNHQVICAYQLRNEGQSPIAMTDISALCSTPGHHLDYTTSFASEDAMLLMAAGGEDENHREPIKVPTVDELIARLVSDYTEPPSQHVPPAGIFWMVQVLDLPYHCTDTVQTWVRVGLDCKVKLPSFSCCGETFEEDSHDLVFCLMSIYSKHVFQAKSVLTPDCASHVEKVLGDCLSFLQLEAHPSIYHNLQRTLIVVVRRPDTIVVYGESSDACKHFVTDLYRVINSDLSIVPWRGETNSKSTSEDTRLARVAALDSELQAVYNLAAKRSNKPSSKQVKFDEYIAAMEALNCFQIETDLLFR